MPIDPDRAEQGRPRAGALGTRRREVLPEPAVEAAASPSMNMLTSSTIEGRDARSPGSNRSTAKDVLLDALA